MQSVTLVTCAYKKMHDVFNKSAGPSALLTGYDVSNAAYNSVHVNRKEKMG